MCVCTWEWTQPIKWYKQSWSEHPATKTRALVYQCGSFIYWTEYTNFLVCVSYKSNQTTFFYLHPQVFQIQVSWTDGTEFYIFRRYSEFYSFHVSTHGLLFQGCMFECTLNNPSTAKCNSDTTSTRNVYVKTPPVHSYKYGLKFQYRYT